jgi:signal peptidase
MKNNIVRQKKRVFSAIVSIAVDVFLAVLVLLILFYVSLNLFMPKKAMDVFKIRLYSIQTGSMEPVLPVGALVLVKKADLSSLEEGDIITVYADVNLDGDKEIITHYYAGVETSDGETYIRTKREAAVFYDSWKVKEEDLIGVYVFHVEYAGKFADFMRSGFGAVAIVLNLLIIVCANYMIDRYCADGMCDLALAKPERDKEQPR